MTSKQLSFKDPAEIIPITFDFTSLTGVITSVDSMSISVSYGIDANVEAMLQGSPQISGSTVIQQVKNGVAGCRYTLRLLINSGSNKYLLSALLPVEVA